MLRYCAIAIVTVFLAVLAVAMPAGAQDFRTANEAYQRGDYTAALKELRPLADQGHASAQTLLGVMYFNGEGVPQDQVQAVKWFRKAAEQGEVLAQLNLAGMYAKDNGVPQDFVQAMKWYRKAAEQGDAFAQNSLGISYLRGEGVPQDFVLAHMWFNLAASRGDQLAVENRDRLAETMTSSQIADAQRLARERKSNSAR